MRAMRTRTARNASRTFSRKTIAATASIGTTRNVSEREPRVDEEQRHGEAQHLEHVGHERDDARREHLAHVLDVVGRARDEAADRIAVEEAEVERLDVGEDGARAGRASRPARCAPSPSRRRYESAAFVTIASEVEQRQPERAAAARAGGTNQRSCRGRRLPAPGPSWSSPVFTIHAGASSSTKIGQHEASVTRDLRAIRRDEGPEPQQQPPVVRLAERLLLVHRLARRRAARARRRAHAGAPRAPRRRRGPPRAPAPARAARRVRRAAISSSWLPALDDAARLEHHDLIGVAHAARRGARRRPRCGRRNTVVELALDRGLGLGIDARERIVEDQDLRPQRERARERRALALAAREHHAALAHERVVAVRQVRRRPSRAGRAAPPRRSRSRSGVSRPKPMFSASVIENRNESCGTIAMLARSVRSGIRLTSTPSRKSWPSVDLEQARDQRRRAWSCPSRSCPPRRASSRPGRAASTSRSAGSRARAGVAEREAAGTRSRRAALAPAPCPARSAIGGLLGEQLVDALHRRRAALHERHHEAEQEGREGELVDVHREREELVDAHAPGADLAAADEQDDPHRDAPAAASRSPASRRSPSRARAGAGRAPGSPSRSAPP